MTSLIRVFDADNILFYTIHALLTWTSQHSRIIILVVVLLTVRQVAVHIGRNESCNSFAQFNFNFIRIANSNAALLFSLETL
ncbi:hypothetical protein BDW59DRAFT_91215 [Aspergillus cavernicola]|uniref:Secreted protein n=1 Tax=Aspergillus cavernicola TaxID=176166 RepID=A0ABR4I860_9EURO